MNNKESKCNDQNFIQKKDGSVLNDLSSRLFDCAIQYTDCTTKQIKFVGVKTGETVAYGDWNGTQCVYKQYTCQ